MNHPYRRMRRQTDHWHFCVNCSGWPREHYQGTAAPPEDGNLCHECSARHAIGSCANGCGSRQYAAALAEAAEVS